MTTLCDVCQKSEFKYKCPKCMKKTCSLACSKSHKTTDKCSGKNDTATNYISSEIIKGADDEKHESNVIVQRDYNYLIGMKREIELQIKDGKNKNKRAFQGINKNVIFNKKNTMNKKSKHDATDSNADSRPSIQKLIRRGVNCIMVPKGMQRSLQNKSKWETALGLFVWSIEWVLFSSDPSTGPFKYVSHRVKETDTISDGIGKIIYEKFVEYYGLPNEETKTLRKEKIVASKIKFYTKWFPQNSTQLDSKTLVPIDFKDKCIGELFRNKTVIEFPTIFIVKNIRDIPSEYTVLEKEPVEVISKQNSNHDIQNDTRDAHMQTKSHNRQNKINLDGKDSKYIQSSIQRSNIPLNLTVSAPKKPHSKGNLLNLEGYSSSDSESDSEDSKPEEVSSRNPFDQSTLPLTINVNSEKTLDNDSENDDYTPGL
ncbi:hypothetical protein TBLA_0A02840 [Henningerozyma blattae CBS 6284]|uniref:HIT-type domain-containing protein n=1 Tax=Henningerozyma blattae (strain ATCC 34711 / CBS 6284 / DSM 70876 / NBRC 10599 / NRRL Y-10934 / UCD 77-7) TaxID=1071380 RepID=I2GVD1_HENB6|nr:hypothetical protein TBLA_0A02840 [Tetrapisispora blattae CBS 6284]CCH58083.1 hypothetical protein TBLA_0A02840 [Tetrapisispora blattae CBS 6284]